MAITMKKSALTHTGHVQVVLLIISKSLSSFLIPPLLFPHFHIHTEILLVPKH